MFERLPGGSEAHAAFDDAWWPGRGPRLVSGMVIAIEPMVNEKSHVVKTLSDGWTVVTADGGLSAHFEHTVAITPKGPVILTKEP